MMLSSLSLGSRGGAPIARTVVARAALAYSSPHGCCSSSSVSSYTPAPTTNPRPLLHLPPLLSRPFQTSAPSRHKLPHNLPPRPKPPPEEEIAETFLKGSGPGGQKINKTASAVQLKHIPTGVVVKSQATRSRSQNRTIARRLLADRLDDMARGTESRAAVVEAVRSKKKASSAKKSRRKYRRLEEGEGEGKTTVAGGGVEVEEAGGELDFGEAVGDGKESRSQR